MRDVMRAEPDPKRTTVLQQLRHAIHLGGKYSLEESMNKLGTEVGRDKEEKYVLRQILQYVAPIIYDQECSGAPIRYRKLFEWYPFPSGVSARLFYIAKPLFEHMLLVDYGIGAYPMQLRPIFQSRFFPLRLWFLLTRLRLKEFLT